MPDFVAGRGLTPTQVGLLSFVTQQAKRAMGDDPARRAQFDGAGAIARDLFRAHGVEPRRDQEMTIATLFSASLALRNLLDAAGRAESPIPAELLPVLSAMADSVMTAIVLGIGIEIGLAPSADALPGWLEERERLAEEARLLEEGGF